MADKNRILIADDNQPNRELLEACAVPVVASRVGGLPEVVTEGETGYLAPVGAVDEMIERSVTLLRDATLHARMRRAAAQRAREFASDQVVPQYEQVYESVLRD